MPRETSALLEPRGGEQTNGALFQSLPLQRFQLLDGFFDKQAGGGDLGGGLLSADVVKWTVAALERSRE